MSISSVLINKKTKTAWLVASMLYSLVWSTAKIVFGVWFKLYFFCVSGASGLLLGFIKYIYLKNSKLADTEEKKGESITIGVLLIVSSLLFVIFMARLFFTSDNSSYGLIWSITIALFSFLEMGLSIYNYYIARKTDDILLMSFRCCNLASGCFAIVLTQVALLSATNSPSDVYNGITGVVFGLVAVMIGVYCVINATKSQNKI